ncbi:RIB43A-like with coiled-coils protein 2 [Neosynchiropus ocellatus]
MPMRLETSCPDKSLCHYVSIKKEEAKMFDFESLSDPVARAKREERHRFETQRKERVFNEKFRTIGLDKQGLDQQVEEKRLQRERETMERNAFDAEMLQDSKLSSYLQKVQAKEQRQIERDIINFRYQYQQPWLQREWDLNDPDLWKKTKPADAQMMIPGLLGEDQDLEARQKRQSEQLREWLIQQQVERIAEKHKQDLEKMIDDDNRLEIDSNLVRLRNEEAQRKREIELATKLCNLAMSKQQRRREHRHRAECSTTPMINLHELPPADGYQFLSGVPGLYPSSDKKEPMEPLEHVIQFQKQQMEEKKILMQERKNEDLEHDRRRLDSARTAMLKERQQARLSRQMRKKLDRTNVQLAETLKEQRPDIKCGAIDETFFTQFNTTSR